MIQRLLILTAAGLGLAACASSRDLPLPARPELVANLTALDHDGIDIAKPMTVNQAALLAVRNDPDLRAVRARRGVAQAQLLQSGLLPNPQITGTALPLVAGFGTTMAWNTARLINHLLVKHASLRPDHFSPSRQAASIPPPNPDL